MNTVTLTSEKPQINVISDDPLEPPFPECITEAGDLALKSMVRENVGDVIAQHRHPHSHVSIVAMGRWRAWRGQKWIGDFGPGQGIFVPANDVHMYQLIEAPGRIVCTTSIKEAEAVREGYNEKVGSRFLRVADGIDVSGLWREIETQPDLWDEITWRKREGSASPHTGMSDIWVRCERLADMNKHGARTEHDSVWYDAYDRLPSIKPIIYDLMRVVQAERIGTILITRIPPGGKIDPHLDIGWHVDYYDKFYVSLKSAPGAKFICHAPTGDEVLEPKVGECWRFDNRILHSVVNESQEDRVTLIVCLRTEKYQGPYKRGKD
jgi:hypothetical protein